MARRKKLSLAGAMAIANKGKARIPKAGRVQKPPSFSMPKGSTDIVKKYRKK